jgi:pyruvate/2-oxoglutarate dehydrogenase complex dihydrolipoamide acyltransferase (E2) component
VASKGSDPLNPEDKQEFQRREGSVGDPPGPSDAPEPQDPDVLLDIPVLNVEEIDLEVDDLRAHVSVRADLANLVNINVGVDAYLNHLKLQIKGVEAQAQLKVRLDKILGTLDRALSAIEANPTLLNQEIQKEEPADQQPGGQDAERTGESAKQTQPPMPSIPDAAQAPLELEEGGESPDGGAGEILATDAARRKARELGVDLARVEATGAGGRILVGDVKRAAGS